MTRFSPSTAIFFAVVVGFAAGAQAQSTQLAYAHSPRNDYIVFFDKSSDTLSASAAKTVRMAARDAGGAHIKLAGSADRTAAVKAELVRQGVPAAQIDERRTRIAALPTADDGVGNPASRRVEITF